MITLLVIGSQTYGWTNADSFRYKDYSWDQRNDRILLSEEEEELPAIVLKNFQAHEYVYSKDNQDLELYSVTHKIVRVNSDDAIQQNNRIYIPMSEVIELIDLKARSISPSGEIVELDHKNIKEIKDEEAGGNYKIFAIEGVQIGSEIEYFYTSKRYVNYFGRNYFQSSQPSKNITFELITPENLTFSCKGYNNFPELKSEVIDGKRIIEASADYVAPIAVEQFALTNANRMRVDYKLSYNDARGGTRLLTWENAAQRVRDGIYERSEDENKTIEKFAKEIKLAKNESTEDKIRVVENHLKTNILVREGSGAEYSDLSSIIQNKYTNERGMVRLFAAVLNEKDIQHELVLTTDRSNVKFDKDLDSWNFLESYAIYFPESDQYLAPDRAEYRYGMIPFYMTNNYGLFVKNVNIGQFETATGEVRRIPALMYDKSYDDIDIEITFPESLDEANLKVRREMGGYSAVFIQPYYSFIPEDRKQETMESLVKLSAEDASFNALNVENGEANLSPLDKPFVVSADINTSSIIERAGRKYLLKLGEVIGPQSELYQDNERQTDVENDFNRSYDRDIKVTIPDGYRIKNADDINIEVFHKIDGDKVFYFKSSYELSDNVLTVSVDEHYKIIDCPKDDFEHFREVINAAADFNKVILVLEKV